MFDMTANYRRDSDAFLLFPNGKSIGFALVQQSAAQTPLIAAASAVASSSPTATPSSKDTSATSSAQASPAPVTTNQPQSTQKPVDQSTSSQNPSNSQTNPPTNPPATSQAVLSSSPAQSSSDTNSTFSKSAFSSASTSSTKNSSNVPSSTSSASPSSSSASSSTGYTAPYYVGIALGIILAIACVGIFVAWIIRLRRQHKAENTSEVIPYDWHPPTSAEEGNRHSEMDFHGQGAVAWVGTGDRDVGEPRRQFVNEDYRPQSPSFNFNNEGYPRPTPTFIDGYRPHTPVHEPQIWTPSAMLPPPPQHLLDSIAYPMPIHNPFSHPYPYNSHPLHSQNVASRPLSVASSRPESADEQSAATLGPLHVANLMPGDRTTIATSRHVSRTFSEYDFPGDLVDGREGEFGSPREQVAGARPRFLSLGGEGLNLPWEPLNPGRGRKESLKRSDSRRHQSEANAIRHPIPWNGFGSVPEFDQQLAEGLLRAGDRSGDKSMVNSDLERKATNRASWTASLRSSIRQNLVSAFNAVATALPYSSDEDKDALTIEDGLTPAPRRHTHATQAQTRSHPSLFSKIDLSTPRPASSVPNLNSRSAASSNSSSAAHSASNSFSVSVKSRSENEHGAMKKREGLEERSWVTYFGGEKVGLSRAATAKSTSSTAWSLEETKDGAGVVHIRGLGLQYPDANAEKEKDIGGFRMIEEEGVDIGLGEDEREFAGESDGVEEVDLVHANRMLDEDDAHGHSSSAPAWLQTFHAADESFQGYGLGLSLRFSETGGLGSLTTARPSSSSLVPTREASRANPYRSQASRGQSFVTTKPVVAANETSDGTSGAVGGALNASSLDERDRVETGSMPSLPKARAKCSRRYTFSQQSEDSGKF